MNRSKISAFIMGAAFGAVMVVVSLILWKATKVTKVHTLNAPLLIAGNNATKYHHLLPAGTTLYFDQSFPEGLSRYKVYINIDRMPLALRDLSDPTKVDPIEARPLERTELAKALRDCSLDEGEIKEIFENSLETKP